MFTELVVRANAVTCRRCMAVSVKTTMNVEDEHWTNDDQRSTRTDAATSDPLGLTLCVDAGDERSTRTDAGTSDPLGLSVLMCRRW